MIPIAFKPEEVVVVWTITSSRRHKPNVLKWISMVIIIFVLYDNYFAAAASSACSECPKIFCMD